MGKTREPFKKITDTKGTFHAKMCSMGSIKDRNGMDLTEAEDIKKRWQEYTEELYKKDLHDLGHRTGKGQFSFQSQRKAMPKNAQTTAQLDSSHTLVK